MNVLHPILLGVDESENMVFGTFQHALEYCQIRHHASSVEVLRAVEDNLVALRCDLQIVVTRIDGSADELDSPVRNTIVEVRICR